MRGRSRLLLLLICSCLMRGYSILSNQKLPTSSRTLAPATGSEGGVRLEGDGSAPSSSSSNWKHYTCPPQTIEELRKRYGDKRNEWSAYDTRQFYKQQLPKALQVDGFLGLNLEERAKLAARSRNIIRKYARERCKLPASVAARFFDGVRHLQMFGYWRTDGLSWDELKVKYTREATRIYPNSTNDEIELNVYRMILEKSCSTNRIFDDYCDNKISIDQLMALMRSLSYWDKGNYGQQTSRIHLFRRPFSKSDAAINSLSAAGVNGDDDERGKMLLTPIQLLLLVDVLAIGSNLPSF